MSEERGWPLGTVVGYRVGLDAQIGPDTILTYMTTGVLLQQLVTAKSMSMYTHIILDEVHERDQEMDFLMLVVRKLSRQQLCRTKVVLMSATFDTDQFSKYFARPTADTDCATVKTECEFINAPVIDVVKNSKHTVNVYHLDQLEQLLDRGTKESLIFDIEKATFNRGVLPAIHALLKAFDRLDAEQNYVAGSVLIFLPGIFEIEDVYEYLRNREETDTKWLLLPLHSSITVEEQKRAFEQPPPGHRKIILSTNIAESSVTVPDVVYVIDFCLTKILVTDSATNYSHLKLSWASRNSCVQRSGRVGRVRNGRVYRFVYSNFFEKELPERTTPEILRCPLHRIVLLSKMLEMGPPHSILALAMDRPDMSNIRRTIDALKEAGALLLSTTVDVPAASAFPRRLEWNERDGDLTPIGRVMAKLPLDIHGSRLVILGHAFGVLKECVIMAAAMMLQNIFTNPFNERMLSYISRHSWSYGSYSDLITYLHVYTVWERQRYAGSMNQTQSEKNWMKRHFLQPKIMREWRLLVNDLRYRLKRLGIDETTATGATMPEHEKAMLIKVVICGAFYPNYFVRSSEGGQIDEEDAVRRLGGRDPFTTVYFTGKPSEQPGQLYVSNVKNLLKDCAEQMKVTFDSGTSGKVYVQFPKESSEGSSRISSSVYRCVKYRLLKLPTVIRCLSPEESRRRLDLWRVQQRRRRTETDESKGSAVSMIPSLGVSSIVISLTDVTNLSDFYVHDKSNPLTEQILEEIFQSLNKKPLIPASKPTVGSIYVAPFQDNYFRAKVVSLSDAKPDGKQQVVVQYIDYGNRDRLSAAHLYALPRTDVMQHPPLAIRCTLAHVRPPISNEENKWPNESVEYFHEQMGNTDEDPLFANIYSVVDDVCALEINRRSKVRGQCMNETINDLLIQKGYARQRSESYLSQEDHLLRERIQKQASEDDEPSASFKYYPPAIDHGDEQNIPPPPLQDCRRDMVLKGPFSPLEMRVFGLTQNSEYRAIHVDHVSVNSVLLDSDPQDPHDRLLVAGAIATNLQGSTLNLRHTTLMPSIPGFPALMAMLWAPRAALHTDRSKTRVISCLCGVGCHANTQRPILPIHDMVFNLDFELTADDVRIINEIREYMNQAMETVHSYCMNKPMQYAIETSQLEIRNRIRSLLQKTRRSYDRVILPQAKSWKHAAFRSMDQLSKDIWPTHAVPNELNEEEQKRSEKEVVIMKQIETMQSIAERRMPMSVMKCELCNITVHEIGEVRVHISSVEHRQRVASFESQSVN